MAGTSEGARKGAITKRKLYGDQFFAEAAKLAGKPTKPKGFAANHELARLAGSKGGKAKRNKIK